MTRFRAAFARSAFTLIIAAAFMAAAPAAKAGPHNDAAMVMDAETGRVLYARSADAARAPASLTKVMTLYILFDQIKAGRMSLDDTMTVSARAATQEPSRLGVKKGQTISVRDAIYALVVVSANDVAMVIAEHIGGTPDKFAQMMTKRARELGMRRTTFRNPSGLPDASQLTTARDMAILSRAIMRNHPRMYDYFRTTSFSYKGRTIRTHNRVLTSLSGANGIKTGYTRASGFNLTTSAERNGKRLIGVVMGGDSWKSRDDEMKTMLEAWFAQLERRPHLVASYAAAPTTAVAEAAPVVVPVAAKPDSVRAVAVAEAAPTPAPRPAAKPAIAAAAEEPADMATLVASVSETPAARPAAVEPTFKPVEEPTRPAERVRIVSAAPVTGDGVLPLATLVSEDEDDIASLIAAGYGDSKAVRKRAVKRAGDWGVQIGAFESEGAARKELDRARASAARDLADAEEHVVAVRTETGRIFYRARFGSFTNAAAQDACASLRQGGFKCVTYSSATAELR